MPNVVQVFFFLLPLAFLMTTRYVQRAIQKEENKKGSLLLLLCGLGDERLTLILLFLLICVYLRDFSETAQYSNILHTVARRAGAGLRRSPTYSRRGTDSGSTIASPSSFGGGAHKARTGNISAASNPPPVKRPKLEAVQGDSLALGRGKPKELSTPTGILECISLPDGSLLPVIRLGNTGFVPGKHIKGEFIPGELNADGVFTPFKRTAHGEIILPKQGLVDIYTEAEGPADTSASSGDAAVLSKKWGLT